MRTLGVLGLLLAALLAGCSGHAPQNAASPPQAAAPTFAAATAIADPCPALRGVDCFEPSIAADPKGRLFVANTSCQGIAASDDGGATFHSLPLPPGAMGMLPGAPHGDCTMQVDPKGRLWFSALVSEVPRSGLGTLVGLQVARSDDGGASWAAGHFFPFTAKAQGVDAGLAVSADRQWLAFAPDGGAWLAYWDWQMGQSFLSRSADSGESWSGMAPMPGYLAGPPVIDAQGTFHSPSQDFGDPYTVLDSQSADGAGFHQVAVHQGDKGQTWCAYPTMAAAADGRLFMAWQDVQQRVLVASSADGGATWSEPVRWNEPGTLLTPGQRSDRDGACPAIGAVGGDLVVMWYRQDGGRQSATLARTPLAAAAAGAAPSSWVAAASYDAAHQTTDFASFAALPDGRLAVAFTDPAVGLRVAVEQPAGAPAQG